MPSLHRDDISRHFRIRFRYQGRQVNCSLHTKDRRRAKALCERVDEMLCLLDRGRITIPDSAESIAFLLSDGQVKQSVSRDRNLGFAKFFATYQERLPVGRKEESTLRGERLHIKHFMRLLGPNRTVQSITKADLQQYVAKRLKECYRGRPIQPDTVRKELVTLRMLWNWGVEEDLLVGRLPTKDVILPLIDEKPPFMTRAEIEAIISRGEVSEVDREKLWKALFLEAVPSSAGSLLKGEVEMRGDKGRVFRAVEQHRSLGVFWKGGEKDWAS